MVIASIEGVPEERERERERERESERESRGHSGPKDLNLSKIRMLQIFIPQNGMIFRFAIVLHHFKIKKNQGLNRQKFT